jgi:hypothetical protein
MNIIHDIEARKAPPGKFRVVAFNPVDSSDWIEGDFDTEVDAVTFSKTKIVEFINKQAMVLYIYNQVGDLTGQSATFGKKNET